MDKKEVIESGILLDYLLGDLTDDVQKELEDFLSTNDELRSYYKELELKFESIAMQNKVQPPADVKRKLLRSISKNTAKNSTAKISYVAKIAASIAILLAVGTGFLFYELNGLKQTIVELTDQNNELNSKVIELNSTVAATQKWYDAINSPEVQKYIMKGNALSPNSTVISYINRSDQTVILNTSFLEKIDDEHDYQLWADVNGEMVDMGIIDVTKPMLAMNYITDSTSLNITIEPKGGSKHPTVTQLISNVYL